MSARFANPPVLLNAPFWRVDVRRDVVDTHRSTIYRTFEAVPWLDVTVEMDASAHPDARPGDTVAVDVPRLWPMDMTVVLVDDNTGTLTLTARLGA